MKKLFTTLMAFFAPMVPLMLSAQQFAQPIPDNVSEIRVEDNAYLEVAEGPAATIASAADRKVASVKGNRMVIGGNVRATITLPAGRMVAFVADDRSQLVFSGSFSQRPRFSLTTNDYATATFSGSLSDTLRATDLNLRADDYSRIHSDIAISSLNFAFEAHDYAAINLACKNAPLPSCTGTILINDNATVDFNYCSGDTVTPFVADPSERRTGKSSLDPLPSTLNSQKKKPSFWRRRDVALNFAWGFHNWGSEPLGGFSGVDGPAEVRTSFNHISLSVDFPLVGTRHTGLYIGLGLEWDKYKFTTPEVFFDPDAAAFTAGTDADCSSRMLTRYVVVPVSFRLDLWHDWRLTLAALPGFHWSGSHTGMRREYETDGREELIKEQNVNSYIAPYKLDFRATLSYSGIGLYLQVPTRSTMKASVQELYPVKFGVMFTL